MVIMACISLLDYGFTLLNLPSAGKEGKLYSVLPQDGTGDFSVSRNGQATIFDQGVFKDVAADVPRIQRKGLRTELVVGSAMTNLCRDSDPDENPGQGNRTNVTFSANDWGIGLNGKVTFDNEEGSVQCIYYNADALTQGNTYTACFIGRRVDGGELLVNDHPVGGDRDIQIAIVQGGSLITITKKENIPGTDLWFVVGVNENIPSASANVGLIKANNISEIIVEASAIMVVDGLVDLSLEDYIRTVGSPVTRPADDVRLENAEGVLPQFSAGAIFTDFFFGDLSNIPLNTEVVSLRASEVAGISRIRVLKGTTTNGLRFLININGPSAYASPLNLDIIPNQRNKILFTFESGDVRVYINGDMVDSSAVVFSSENPIINDFVSNVQFPFKQIIRAYSKTPITHEQATELTTP